eukprot:Lankesteria_metandrocarpae@DN9495_c0_g1_i1.p1
MQTNTNNTSVVPRLELNSVIAARQHYYYQHINTADSISSCSPSSGDCTSAQPSSTSSHGFVMPALCDSALLTPATDISNLTTKTPTVSTPTTAAGRGCTSAYSAPDPVQYFEKDTSPTATTTSGIPVTVLPDVVQSPTHLYTGVHANSDNIVVAVAESQPSKCSPVINTNRSYSSSTSRDSNLSECSAVSYSSSLSSNAKCSDDK